MRLPFFRKKGKEDDYLAKAEQPTRKTYVLTVRGRQELEWLQPGRWEPPIQTVIPNEAESPLVVTHFGTYGSDGIRLDGPPTGAYSAVYELFRTRGRDIYSRDEHRKVMEWDTRLA